VLLHGALSTHRDWLDGPFDALARDFRVTAVDRPGHGLSLRPRFSATPRDQAVQIAEGLDALDVGRALIVGHSMGGLVALAIAERFPERVSGLVLLAPIAFPEARPLEHALLAPRATPLFGPWLSALAEKSMDRPMLKAVQRLMFLPQAVPPAWEEHYPYDQILTAKAMVNEGEEASAILPFAPAGLIDLGAIRVPVHIVTGTADRVADPNRHARLLPLLLRDATLTELPGIGHMLHHAATDSVLAVVRDALLGA
jgi:pimeloyl-ACP methyl ester carboxylesterase